MGDSLFGSKFRAFRVSIRPEQLQLHPITGQIISERPRMVAEFGLHGEEFEIENELGQMVKYGDIRGFFYDLDTDAEAKGWTDDEKEAARERLLRLCKTWPEAIWVIEPTKLEAPWPAYDNMGIPKIADFARDAGLLREAFDYESQNKARKTVLSQLQQYMDQPDPQDDLIAA